MDELNVQSLLSKATEINKKYEEIAKITGENYNVFEILGLQKKEDSHSRLLANLLDPKGTHGQGINFLKSFLRYIGTTEDIDDRTLEKAKIITEEDIGCSKDYSEGGRIDIVIKIHPVMVIVIENKIYAQDQLKQLWRYKCHYREGKLYYLTLDGRDPEEHSICGYNSKKLEKDKDFKCISYKEHIINWLEQCKKEVNYPHVRETLIQYTNTIKDLTGQSKNDKMNEEIEMIILREKDNIKAATAINNALNNLNKLKETQTQYVLKQIKDDPEIIKEIDPNYISSNGGDIYLGVPGEPIFFTAFIDEEFSWEIYAAGYDNLSTSIKNKFEEYNSRISHEIEIDTKKYKINSSLEVVVSDIKKWLNEFIQIRLINTNINSI